MSLLGSVGIAFWKATQPTRGSTTHAKTNLDKSGFWYEAFRQRYHWSHTTFAGARFRSTLRGAELLGVWMVNILLLVFTLGLAWPWVEIRNARVHLANLTLIGDLDVGAIEQEAQIAEATGEEVADFLDLDLGWF